MSDKRLRYVCEECSETNVTARGHKVHARRHHHGDRVAAERRWVEVEP